MLYHSITKDDMLNGEGLRVVLWVAGCEHCCPGCQNPNTWDPAKGEPFTEWENAKLMELVKLPHINGITFSGGDPLHPNNISTVGQIAREVSKLPGKDIWLYTGYTLRFENKKPVLEDPIIGKRIEESQIPWLSLVDILVDGRYGEKVRKKDILNGKDPNWRGSSNQKIIDVKASLKEKEVIIYPC